MHLPSNTLRAAVSTVRRSGTATGLCLVLSGCVAAGPGDDQQAREAELAIRTLMAVARIGQTFVNIDITIPSRIAIVARTSVEVEIVNACAIYARAGSAFI